MSFVIPTEFENTKGTVYGTCQLFVQQAAYALTNTIFDYSSSEFDLDSALKIWLKTTQKNPQGVVPQLVELETRVGAASALLGYVFSQYGSKLPTSVLATVGTLQYMQPILAQYALSGTVSAPLSFHVAAVSYNHGVLVNDYAGAQEVSQTLGLGLVVSNNVEEIQDISILSTLLAKIQPSVHIYDGVRGIAESNRLRGVLSGAELSARYAAVAGSVTSETSISGLFKLYNTHTGSSYEPFEYSGAQSPHTVIVSFGAVASTISTQVANKLSAEGASVGAINVRLFSPWLEDEFLKALPRGVKKIVVVEGTGSRLLSKAVSTSVVFNSIAASVEPYTVVNGEELSPREVFSLFGASPSSLLPETSQYVFWDIDDSATSTTARALAHTIGLDNSKSVNFVSSYDNDLLGGVLESEIRVSSVFLNAPYRIADAGIVFVTDARILSEFDVLANAAENSTVVLAGSGDIAEKLPAQFKKHIALDYPGVKLVALDYEFLTQHASAQTDSRTSFIAEQIVFWRIADPSLTIDQITTKIVLSNGADTELVAATVASLAQIVFEKALNTIEVSQEWGIEEEDEKMNDEDEQDEKMEDEKLEDEKLEDESTSVVELPVPTYTKLISTSFSQTNRSLFETREFKPAVSSLTQLKKDIVFKEAYEASLQLRPDLPVKNGIAKISVNQRVTPDDYDRHIFHLELDITGTGLTYAIGEALGVHASNNVERVKQFIEWYELDPEDLVTIPARDDSSVRETKTIFQALKDNLDIFGKPSKKFYESLANYASDKEQRTALVRLASPAGAADLKTRTEVNLDNYSDVLREFTSARPSGEELFGLIAPLKRREYSIASSQKAHPNSVHLLIVVVDWIDGKGRKRYGQASKYLADLEVGSEVVVSVKPSVMKLPSLSTTPIIMAGLGTGLAPFKAFLEEKAWQKANGYEIGEVYLFLGSRHQRQEYLYGELFEAYRNAGILTYIGAAFSRDQPEKIYIQDRIVQASDRLVEAFVNKKGSFYLCGPTWPVPDISAALADIVGTEAATRGVKIDAAREIETLKEEERYILEVY